MVLGFDGYVSPSRYESKREHGIVRAWNYTAAHASGPTRRIEELGELRELVNALTQQHESPRPRPWQVGDAAAAFLTEQLQAILGFEITIHAQVEAERCRVARRFRWVIDGLAGSADATDVALATTMKRVDALSSDPSERDA